MRVLARGLGLRVHYVLVGSGSGRVLRQDAPEVPAGYRVTMADLDTLLPYADLPNLPLSFLQAAFAEGDVCVASFHQQALVGFSFQSTTRAPVTDQLDVLIPPGFRYTYKTWVHADHRRRNLSQIQNYVRAHSRPSDDRLSGVWYVETHNYASRLHSYRHPRDRALSIGLIGWFSFRGREIPFRTPAARWLGIELVRREDRRPRQVTR